MDIDYDLNDNSDCDEDDNCYSSKSDQSSSSAYYSRLENSQVHTNPVYPRPEEKIIDVGVSGGTSANTLSLTATGVVVALNDDIVTGTSLRQMIGNQVTIRSLSYRFLPPSSACRICFVWDRQPNGATASYSDIFSTFGVSTMSIYNHLNFNNRQRFVILRDFTYPSPLNGTVNFECGKIPIDMVSTYSDAQVTPLVPQTGALLLAALGPTGTLTGILRIRYYDN